MAFDPWDGDTAPHMLVTGKTGAGKSFLVADLILQQRRRGAAVFVLDKGDSYRRLAELLGGQSVRLSAESPLTINPLAGPGDADHQAFLLRLLAEMAAGGEARAVLSREEYGLLGEAIATLFAEREAGAESTLSDLARLLEQPRFAEDGTGRRLRRRLFPFLAAGPYGRYFDGPNAFRPDAALTVVELGDIATKRDLRAATVLVLMHAIRTFASTLPIGQRKLVVIDEAWSLLASEDSAAALAEAARTYRKLNAAAVFLSQRLEDFEGPHGKAVRDNCAVRWLLEQAPEAIGTVRDAAGPDPGGDGGAPQRRVAQGRLQRGAPGHRRGQRHRPPRRRPGHVLDGDDGPRGPGPLGGRPGRGRGRCPRGARAARRLPSGGPRPSRRTGRPGAPTGGDGRERAWRGATSAAWPASPW